jgi:hypothetical protein
VIDSVTDATAEDYITSPSVEMVLMVQEGGPAPKSPCKVYEDISVSGLREERYQ